MAKILICDDSDFMRQTIKDILESGKHEVIGEAKDGDEAVTKFLSHKPDLATMDILMKPDGLEAIKRIKEIDRSAKIVIVSILEGSQAEIVESIRFGAQGYVGKPIKRETLLGEVKRVLKS